MKELYHHEQDPLLYEEWGSVSKQLQRRNYEWLKVNQIIFNGRLQWKKNNHRHYAHGSHTKEFRGFKTKFLFAPNNHNLLKTYHNTHTHMHTNSLCSLFCLLRLLFGRCDGCGWGRSMKTHIHLFEGKPHQAINQWTTNEHQLLHQTQEEVEADYFVSGGVGRVSRL